MDSYPLDGLNEDSEVSALCLRGKGCIGAMAFSLSAHKEGLDFCGKFEALGKSSTFYPARSTDNNQVTFRQIVQLESFSGGLKTTNFRSNQLLSSVL